MLLLRNLSFPWHLLGVQHHHFRWFILARLPLLTHTDSHTHKPSGLQPCTLGKPFKLPWDSLDSGFLQIALSSNFYCSSYPGQKEVWVFLPSSWCKSWWLFLSLRAEDLLYQPPIRRTILELHPHQQWLMQKVCWIENGIKYREMPPTASNGQMLHITRSPTERDPALQGLTHTANISGLCNSVPLMSSLGWTQHPGAEHGISAAGVTSKGTQLQNINPSSKCITLLKNPANTPNSRKRPNFMLI